MEPTITHDLLLDYAQGRLSPAEMTRISRLLLQDPALQRRYAEVRRLQRLLREQYQPEAVAHPEARDEAVATMITGYVEAIRYGVAPATEYAGTELVAVPPADSSASHDAMTAAAGAVPATEPASPGLEAIERELAALHADLKAAGIRAGDESADEAEAPPLALPTLGAPRRSALRHVAGYAAAAAVLIGAAAVSFIGEPPAPVVGESTEGEVVAVPGREMVPPPAPVELEPPRRDAADWSAPEGIEVPDGRTEVVNADEQAADDSAVEPRRPDGSEVEVEAEAVVERPGDADAGAVVGSDNGSRRPGGVNVPSGSGSGSRADSDLAEMIRRIAESDPVRNLRGQADDSSHVLVERGPLRGDLNADGVIDEADVRLLRQALIDLDDQVGLHARFGQTADLDGDGVIDIRDLNYLRRLVHERLALEATPADNDGIRGH